MAKNKWIAMLLVLLLVLTAPRALAAEQGSIQVCGIDQSVCLYFVAAADGTPADDFADSTVDLADEAQAAAKAKALWKLAREKDLAGQTQQADAAGNVLFEPLEEGLYLLVSAAEEPEFDPFLVKLPTLLDGKQVYHIEAKPKQEEAPPTEPTTPPTEPPRTDIPQTGNSVTPIYLLMGGGILVTMAGLYQMIRGKEERYE